MSHAFEIEIKCLLGSKENAERLKAKLKEHDPASVFLRANKQLNHYFNAPRDLSLLARAMTSLIPKEKLEPFSKIVAEGKNVSIRTRAIDGTKVLFIIKASIGDDSSANGVSRIEFEVPVQKTIDALDQLLLDAGCTYQAKWSREREEYRSGKMTITIDKNAGYGYLAEFERTDATGEEAKMVEQELRSFMAALGAEELSQDRLERMFAHYNKHWDEYYGTDKTFTIQ